MTVIQGFAHVWHSPSDCRDYAFAPHAFSWWCRDYGKAIPLLFQHEDEIVMARRGRAGTLALWSTDYGLAFEAAISARHIGMIGHDVTHGRMGCSMEFKFLRTKRGFLQGQPPRGTSIDDMVEMPMGEVVHRASLHEVTLTTDPAFEAGRVWFGDADEFDTTAEVREQRAHWRAGRDAIDRGADPWPASAEDERDAREARLAKASPAKVVQLPTARRAPQAFAVARDDDPFVEGLMHSGWSRREALEIQRQQAAAYNLRAHLAGPPRKRR